MHQHELLPSWIQPIKSIIIILQKCSASLSDRTLYTECDKDWLRDRFFKIAWNVASTLDSHQYQCDLFDPRTGLPVRSPHGALRLDDVAVVRESLDYQVQQRGSCVTLIHPEWGDAVYPASLVSTASTTEALQSLGHLLKCPLKRYASLEHRKKLSDCSLDQPAQRLAYTATKIGLG